MTVRLSTTISNIEKIVSNEQNVEIIKRFFLSYHFSLDQVTQDFSRSLSIV